MMNMLKAFSIFLKAVLPQDGDSVLDLNQMANTAINSRPVRETNENFWPSSINSPFSCNRKLALSRIEGIWTDQIREDPERVKIMDVGRVLHEFVQNNYWAKSGQLYGRWKCPHCGHYASSRYSTIPSHYCPNTVRVEKPMTILDKVDKTPQPPPVTCKSVQESREKRGEPIWEYEEIKVFHPDLLISGRIDAVFILPGGYWITGEGKTLEDAAFRGLQEQKPSKDLNLPEDVQGILKPSFFPLPASYHVNQGSIYSELLLMFSDQYGLDPNKYRGTMIIYINRQNLQQKTFIRKNSSLAFRAAQNTIETIQDIVAAAKALEPNTDLSRVERDQDLTQRRRSLGMNIGPACKTRTDKKAKECPWQTICFPYTQKGKLHLNGVNALPPRGCPDPEHPQEEENDE